MLGHVQKSGDPWCQRNFQKDRLRVTERYWHRLSSLLPIHNAAGGFSDSGFSCMVIPDGKVWRCYLPLLSHLLEFQQQQILERPNAQHKNDDDDPNRGFVHLVLLESAAELMDWRNLNPCLATSNHPDGCEVERMRESTAPRERTKILRLLEQQQQQTVSHNVPLLMCPFCDLSVQKEECDEWDVLGYPSMSVVERSLHALARAGRMLQHGSNNQIMTSTTSQPPPVILLVKDDQEERLVLEQAVSDDDDQEIIVLDITEFLDYVGSKVFVNQQDLDSGSSVQKLMERLQDIRRRCDEDYKRRNTPVASDDNDESGESEAIHEHWTEDEIETGLQKGDLVRGRLEVSKFNPKEAFVNAGGAQYFVNRRLEHFNRALHGDVVVLKRLPESQWGRPIGRRRIVFNADNNNDDNDDNDNSNDNKDGEETPAVPSGRVVGIASPSTRSNYVATLIDIPLNDESNILLVPMDMRIPKIRVATKSWKKYLNQRLLVKVDGWEIGSNYPHGRCEEILGPIGDMEVEIKCLLLENEIDLDPFSAAATACLPPTGSKWTVPEEEISSRRDLRKSRRIFSVDPPGCQDIDDTMHAEVLPNGDIEVGVHIADVTYFVSHNSPLDLEAQKRGTTFYLVDRRFDMLPTLLSSDLCSLHGEVDRLAVSAIWTLSPDLENVKSAWYGRTIIHNCQAMTYDQAHNILHDKNPDDPGKPVPPPLTAGYPVDPKKVPQLKKDLTILRDLGRKLKKRREEVGGAVDLSSGDLGGELKFTLDKDGNPVAVKAKQELEIHNTIAEMMIMANGHVASKIFDSFPESALLRIHRSVEQSRFDSLKNVLDAGGVSLDGNSNMELANTLKKVEKAGAVVNSLIKSLATRAMSEAQYICTGQHKDRSDLSHYGLGVDHYTHFTSPIRRYADVIVHKQLLASLEKERLRSTMGSEEAGKEFAEPERPSLPVLPDSNVISIMAGEGIDDVDTGADVSLQEDLDGDDFLDSLIEGASELALGVPEDTGRVESSEPTRDGHAEESNEAGHMAIDEATTISGSNGSGLKPYLGSEVAKIADSLNKQNRMAKHSSMECQNLFLSLYFRDHEEVAQAVVTDLRVNGFFVYIPQFDISGAVYLRDVNGDVQIDPSLLGLPLSSGQPPTMAFAASSSCRRFPSGQCKLVESLDGSPGGARLEVSVPGSTQTFTVRTVDVVTINLRCDNWDVRSRVPPPRFLLVSKGSRPPPGFGQSTSTRTKINSKALQDTSANKQQPHVGVPEQAAGKKALDSMFDVLQSIEIQPNLSDVPLRSLKPCQAGATIDRQEEFKGRLVFGEFKNPNEKSQTQQVMISAASQAAAQRRANAAQTTERRSEYDTVRRIESSVMARTQRLAADKRNTRRSKAK